jgi:hypothetical protein
VPRLTVLKFLYTVTITLAVAGCNKPDPRICSSLARNYPDLTARTSIAQRSQIAATCIEGWAARLATGPDRISEVAEGAIGGCETTLIYYRNAKLEAGYPADTLAEMRDFWRRRATFVALQVRAGNCHHDA